MALIAKSYERRKKGFKPDNIKGFMNLSETAKAKGRVNGGQRFIKSPLH